MTDTFLERFRSGFRAYQAGRWAAARPILQVLDWKRAERLLRSWCV